MCFYCVSVFESELVATSGCTFKKLESASKPSFFQVMFLNSSTRAKQQFSRVSFSVRQEETTSLAINWFEWDPAKYRLKDSVHMTGTVRRDFDEW